MKNIGYVLLGWMACVGYVQQGSAQKIDTLSLTGDEPFVIVENMPRFPGCDEGESVQERDKCALGKMQEFLVKHITYPADAMEMGITGTVIVSFIVERDGSLSDIQIMKQVDSLLADEAIRVVKEMPKWEPGIQRGKLVRTKFMLPLRFALDDDAPTPPEQIVNMGMKLVEEGEHDRAILYFNEAINRQPDLAQAHYELGHAYQLKGETEKACEAFAKAAELGDADARKKTEDLCGTKGK
ncbi:MAG: TonB family protein [Flavobacteriales bacterium]|nr:TonB family protein [Flavobacteriales bacterium]MCB9448644.1 TonB family protein [Flavobacteriales bacterium]